MPESISKYFKTESGNEPNTSLKELQDQWTSLYAHLLPSAALQKSEQQKKWPVHLNHCFARIILDNVVGKDTPWTEKLSSPAVKHMTEEQLHACIEMAEDILSGAINLVQLDEESLRLRGKKSKKRKIDDEPKDERKTPVVTAKNERSKKVKIKKDDTNDVKDSSKMKEEEEAINNPLKLDYHEDDEEKLIATVNSCSKTPFQKRVLLAIMKIPKGRFTTYASLAKHLSSHPRAVGNALRNNPFAPAVPCHRIVAADRSIGGFGGEWGKEGQHANKKIDLLKSEGVKFDSTGKVKGLPYEFDKE